MTFASDKLYKDVIQKMLSRLASIVKVREIIPHLDCLTLTDREEIEAKREVAGNYNAMQVLMDCLRRRENWPEQFIRALEACEQQSLANEISDAYDRIRGINPQRSAPPAAAAAAAASVPAPAAAAAAVSPPPPAHVATPAAAAPPPAPSPVPALVTTVTTATIHKAPRSTPPLLTPSPEGPPAPPAASAPAQSPPGSLPRIDAPGPAEASVSVSVSAPEAPAPSPPKPAQPVEPSPPMSASPPVSVPQVTPSLQQNEVSFRSGATSSLDSSSDLTLSAISEPSSVAATSLPISVIVSSPFQLETPETSSQPPSSSSKESKTPPGITESPTSVKHPIQDTSPPQKVSVLTQDVSSTVSQRMETAHSMVPPSSQALPTSPGMAQVSPSASHSPAVESVEYFSKPGILMGAEPSFASSDDLQISRPPTESAGSSPVQPARPAPVSSNLQPREQSEEPCSVTSDQLMLSNATPSTAGSSLSQPPTVAPGNLVPNSTPEENSFSEQAVSSSENQPVEDTYESFQSLQAEPATMVHIVQVNEEPSILNGQPPSMMGNAAHANEIQLTLNHNRPTESVSRSVMSENQPSLKSQSITQTTQGNEVHANEQAGACPKPTTPACQVSGLNASSQPEQSEEAQRALLLSDPRFMAAAAAVGVAAFIAWKLKH